jgi:hypothetical protein
MTAQVILGAVFVLVGLGVKVAQAAGLLGIGEIGFVGEVSNLGMLLLGKELLNKSPAAQARTSLKPPPAAGAVLLACMLPLMQACAGTPSYDPLAAREAANDIRAELNEAHDVALQAGALVPLACAYLGEGDARCKALEDGYAVLRASFRAGYAAADLIDTTGIATAEATQGVQSVISAAHDFGSAVTTIAAEVANVLGERSGGQGAGPDHDAGGGREQGAPAPSPEGEAAPNAAPAPQ